MLTAAGPSERERRTRAAWEKFVMGDDDVHGVSPLILLSWHRSRDVYGVDPLHASPPPATGPGHARSLLHDTVLTQLGGVAAALANRYEGSLTTVTDGSGQVLGCWGARDVRRRGADDHLAPMFTWSEPAAGTNGVGTAMGRARPMSVHGSEHWCASLRQWNCTGISISDTISGEALAVLTVSFWRQQPTVALPAELERAAAPLRSLLAGRAARDGTALVECYTGSRVTSGQALIAVDVAGNVVAANQYARMMAPDLPAVPAVEPVDRRRPVHPQLARIAADARRRAEQDPDWTGDTRLDLLGEETAFDIRPVIAAGDVVGVLLVGSDRPAGEPMACRSESAGRAHRPVVGTCGERLIILHPGEIRYAEADKHAVWLVTDRGRVRAAGRGLDNIERELVPFGFLRVHRGFLVNVHRIREVDQGFCKGTLTVSTQHHGREAIPVARRHVPRLRAALGL